MGKSRKNVLIKRLNKTARESLPVIDKGLKTVGTTAKDVAQSSIPIIEKGVSGVYGTMATGLDLGVKGVEALSSNLRNRPRSISRSLSRGRSRALSRGRSRALSRGRSLARGRSRSLARGRTATGGLRFL